MRNKISVALFLLGLLIISYPFIAKMYYNCNNQTELVALNRDFQSNSDAQVLAHEEWLSYNQSLIDNNHEIVSPPVEVKDDQDIQATTGYTEDVIATIEIPVLDIHYPIYDKATPENLNHGVARVEGTSFPTGGKSTNSVLAAHANHSYQEWFTNINKLHKNDLIIINSFKETLYYSVYDMEIIEPSQVEKLAIIKDKDIVTLLTCTIGGKQRVIVYAERTDTPEYLLKSDIIQRDLPDRTVSSVVYEPNWLSNLIILLESKWIIVIIIIITIIFLWQIRLNTKSIK